MMRTLVLGATLAATSLAVSAQLALAPTKPAPIDTVRLRYAHSGCVNLDTVRLVQVTARITVMVDRAALPGCPPGTVDDFTLGRLPPGEYDVELIVGPPAGALGASTLLGPLHFSVSPSPAPGTSTPRDNYGDLWWNAQEPGWALMISQSGERLFAVWAVYDVLRRPTWYVMPSGNWSRDSSGALHFAGSVYRTTGSYWAAPYSPSTVDAVAVGTADFYPTSAASALFSYTIEGVTSAKNVERFKF